MRVCFVGDDVHPPWNHASSILTKRLIECVSPSADCFLATVSSPYDQDPFFDTIKKALKVKPSNVRGLTAARLSVIAKRTFPDIIHLVGTNALVFAPVSKLLGASSKIVRHIFTSYDRSDLAIRPVRWLANTVFIDSYAFTTPRIGPWADERSFRTKRFLVRPPINCDLYRPIPKKDSNPMARSEETILYMGPLWGSRFPAVRVLKAIRLLSRKGTDPHLLVLTSATRTSPMESERLISLARNAGLENRITVQRVDLSEEQRVMAYNRADVVIFPYTGPIPERLADPPFGILEAMSCGRPILATDVLSISEVVKDGDTGLVAIDSTPENIADGLYRALKNSDRAKIERNARQRIMEDFSYPVVRERLLASYASLVKLQAWGERP